MIIKTKIGKGFGGTVNYVMGKDQAEVLQAEGVRMDSPRSMIDDFCYQASDRPDIGNKVWHASFSFDHADQVTPELMKQVADDYAKKFGFDQYAVIRHHDTPHEHFHLIGNRVKMDGQTVSDQFSASRGVEQAKIYERRYNLQQAQGKGRDLSKTNAQKLNPFERSKLDVYQTVKSEMKGSKSLEDLQSRLEKKGIGLQAHTNSSGVYGVSFKQGKNCFKGSQLGKEFTAKALQNAFSAAIKITPLAPAIGVVKGIKDLGRDKSQGMEM